MYKEFIPGFTEYKTFFGQKALICKDSTTHSRFQYQTSRMLFSTVLNHIPIKILQKKSKMQQK